MEEDSHDSDSLYSWSSGSSSSMESDDDSGMIHISPLTRLGLCNTVNSTDGFFYLPFAIAPDVKHRHKYIIELSRAFLTYGAPTHRVEKQLKRTAITLGIRSTEFLLLPNIIFISFHDEDASHSNSLHIIMQIGGIFLSQLRATHQLYEEVAGREEDDLEDDDGVDYDYDYDYGNDQQSMVRRESLENRDKKRGRSEKGQEEEDDDGEEEGEEDDYSDDSDGDQLESEDSVEELGGQADTRADEEERLNPEDGWKQLDLIRTSPPPFSRWEQCFIAFLAGFTITVLAFDGSTADAACAGAFAWLLTCLALFASGSNPLIAKVFELLAAFLISAFSRGLYSHTNHRLCYSAISSGGIVLILPGFSVSE